MSWSSPNRSQGNDFEKGITISVANEELLEEYRELRRLSGRIDDVGRRIKAYKNSHKSKEYKAFIKRLESMAKNFKYDPELLAAVIYGIKLIKQMGGKVAVLTATFPPFVHEELKNILGECPDRDFSDDGITMFIRNCRAMPKNIICMTRICMIFSKKRL